MSKFSITDSGSELQLSQHDGKFTGKAAFSVRNETSGSILARADIKPEGSADAAWFKVVGESERMLQRGESTSWTVQVDVPPTAETGDYRFQLQAVDADLPGEGAELSAPTRFHHEKPDPNGLPWKLIIAIAAGVLVLVAAGILIASLMGGAEMPTLEGKKIADARKELEELGVTINEEILVSDADEFTVLSQDPAPGTTLDSDATVTITYEAPWVTIPDLVGKELTDDVIETVNGLKLSAADPEPVLEDISKAGRVISTDPAAGERVKQGSAFSWKVEEPAVPVPNLVGKSFADALRQLDEGGFKHKMTVVTRDAAKQGQVLEQNPQGGTLLQRGRTELTLTVEKSRIECPNVTGLTKGKAEKALKDAKLKVRITSTRVALSGAAVGSVAIQRPSAGSPMLEGGTVTLQLVGKSVRVPSVTGKTRAQALDALKKAGLKASARSVVASKRTQINRVLQQSKAPRTVVVEGTTIKLIIADKSFKVGHITIDPRMAEKLRKGTILPPR